jgi:molybdate transport system substrate-binding protein
LEAFLQVRKITIAILILFLVSLLSSCNQKKEERIQLTISAAASMKDVLTELKQLYEQDHQVELLFNFGGSGSLKQQIIQGAPVDLFISASKDHMDELVEKQRILSNYHSPLVGNSLVLITPKNENHAELSLTTLKDQTIEKIAIGIPETVPAGSYAKEALHNAQLWNQVKEKLIYTKDVSQVLTYVETKNVNAGIVYKTDAKTSKKIVVTENIDSSLHSPIMYYYGVLENTNNSEKSKSVFEFLQTPAAQQVFEKYGFYVLE